MRKRVLSLVLFGLVMSLTVLVVSCGGSVVTTTPPQQNPGTATTLASAGNLDGKPLYEANCASCHGPDLTGGKGPTLKGQGAISLGFIEAQILNGGGEMPAFKGKLSDEEVASIANYILKVR
jgi:cytochrome c551